MDALQDEVESLEAILMDDVRITRNEKSGSAEIIETTIYPLLDEESDQQYVCLTLQVFPTPNYPDEIPKFKLMRPRGLDDSHLEAIRTACNKKLEDSLGFPVVFDLIEVIRDRLTDTGNLPSGQCVICLYNFSDGDEFTRTECFHYLHSYCLARHLNASRKNYHEEFDKLPAWLQKTADPFQVMCPVCREPIKDESDSLKCAMPPAELQNAPEFQLTKELLELQKRMSALYLEQKSRGAIIDIEAESLAVISIETEDEIRRRVQRKQRQLNKHAATAAACADGSSSINNGTNGLLANSNRDVSPKNEATTSAVAGSKQQGGNKLQFAPVVDEVPATAANGAGQRRIESSNNNYEPHQQGRRHLRGGRRHQYHHHHHREREQRLRERYEHNHLSNSNSSQNNANDSAAGSQAMTLPASSSATASAHSSGGKHSKNHAHPR